MPTAPQTSQRSLAGLRTALWVQVDDLVPGRSGPFATTEAHDADAVLTSFNPDTDGDPDPGEIVWTGSIRGHAPGSSILGPRPL
jgi:hypothetical protein